MHRLKLKDERNPNINEMNQGEKETHNCLWRVEKRNAWEK